MAIPHKHTMTTRLFHHLTLVLLIAVVVALKGFENIQVHKVLGVIFLLWVVARIINLIIRPKFPRAIMPKWQIALSYLVHFGLYASMLAMPLVGVLMSLYGGREVDVFGIIRIPVFVTPDREMAGLFHYLHTNVILPIFVGLIGVHILAAMYHQFIIKDNLMMTMR